MKPQLASKPTLDKDLDKLSSVEEAAGLVSRGLVAPGIALLFIALAAVLATIAEAGIPDIVLVVAAAAVAGYMALAIGANDVANNISAAVGAKALTLASALAIAAVFETAGALIGGRNVVETISSQIIPPAAVAQPAVLMIVMLSALLAAALWVHLATWIGAPVSTTHSIVGAVLGAGAAALGASAVNWWIVGAITASWIISPIAGAMIAIAFLYLIKTTVIYQDDKIAAARRWVPLHVAIMGASFIAYLFVMLSPGKFSGQPAMVAGILLPSILVLWAIMHRFVAWQAVGLENRNQSLRVLFRIPLVVSAALLSFSHGANDVANAVGPLAAIVSLSSQAGIGGGVIAPNWVMLVGALGISVGIMLYGPKLVRMVGQQITRLNPVRGFCVALAVAITVLLASTIGMPISSTHVAVGAVFGVGFFREWYTANSSRRRDYLARRAAAKGDTGSTRKGRPPRVIPRTEATRRRLVRSAHITTILAAWLITVPLSAALAAALYMVFAAIGG